MRSKPGVSEQQAANAVARVLGTRPRSARLIPTLEDNRVFAIDDASLYAKFGPRDRTLKEVYAYRAAGQAGVPVPQVRASGEADGVTFIVVDAAPGVPVAGLTGPQRDRALRELGAALGALHAVAASGWGAPDIRRLSAGGEWVGSQRTFRPADVEGWGLAYLEEQGALDKGASAAIRAWIADVGEVPSERSCLLHRDVTSECAYADPSTGALLAVIDFGDAQCGLPFWEFTTLAVREPDALGAVAEGYGFDLAGQRELIAISTLVRLIDGARYHHQAGLDEWRQRVERIRTLLSER